MRSYGMEYDGQIYKKCRKLRNDNTNQYGRFANNNKALELESRDNNHTTTNKKFKLYITQLEDTNHGNTKSLLTSPIVVNKIPNSSRVRKLGINNKTKMRASRIKVI